MSIVEILLAIIGLLGGAFLWTKSKKDNAEALLQNTETKEKSLVIDKEITKVDANLQLEELKREELTTRVQVEKENEVSLKDIADLINRK